jgi:hypothetical protein
MTPEQIAADVERGIEIKRQLVVLTAELKAIEDRLEQAGLNGQQVPLQDKDREGRQFLARGRKLVIPVVFESDQIIGSFQPGSDLHTQIAELAGKHLAKFFKDTRVFKRVQKEGNDFRKEARKIFGTDAPAFIAACLQRDKESIPKSRTVIAWDNARDADAVPS